MTDATQEKQPEVELQEERENPVAILQPVTEPRTWTLTFDGEDREYTQKPLSFFGKMEFFSLVGEAIDNAMKGDNGLTVNGMLNAVSPGATDFSQESLVDADTFMASIAKIAVYAPEFLKDCYCVWLGVSMSERMWARAALENLSDEDGIAIVETFIDQNVETLKDFFNEKLRSLVTRAQEKFGDGSQSSKPSKPTRRNTRKRSTS